MRRMGVVMAVLLAASAAVLAEEAAAGKHPVPAKAVDADAAKLAEALKTKKLSFDFVDTPLRDVAGFLRGVIDVNIILDPDLDGTKTITLKVTDMAADSALQWVARVAGAEMRIEDGAVYLAATDRPKPPRAFPYQYGRPVGKALIDVGGGVTIELQLYEDDLDPDTRKMLLKVIHQALIKELAKAEKGK